MIVEPEGTPRLGHNGGPPLDDDEGGEPGAKALPPAQVKHSETWLPEDAGTATEDAIERGERFVARNEAAFSGLSAAFEQDLKPLFEGWGDEAARIAQVVLDALGDAGFAGAVEIVATSANPNLAALRERVARRPDTTLSLDLPDLAAFFARHDLQVGAGGGATWERCCIGVPTLLVVVAPNQNTVAPALAAEGAVAFAPEPTRECIAAQLAALLPDAARRRALAEKSRELVDGQGATRVALAMLAGTLTVRPATTDDARIMFDWRDDPATRAVSRTSGALEWDGHVAWLERVLADPERQLFVGTIGGRPVGVIRFDFSSEDRAEVSLYLDPALHGLGLGPHLLLAGEDAADPRTVDATVLESNRASQRLFATCGYEQVAPDRWVKQRG